MISIVIPVYKNTEQFLGYLKKNLLYLRGYEVIVVNDDPSESMKEKMRSFKDVTLIENNKNIGFGQTVNKGIVHAKYEYVFLLNSDVLLKDTSFKQAAEQIKKNADIFAISFAQIEKDGSTVGKNTFFWKQGFFYHEKAKNTKFGFNGWAEGGSCMINKSIFEELNGFDPLYTPFYWEDIDISYRAWKKGYKVIFDPDILVEHHHGGTTNKYIQPDFKDSIAARNHYIFIWKNVTDSTFIWQHIAMLPYNLFYFAIKQNRYLLKGFFLALLKLPQILKVRSQTPTLISDVEVMKLVQK